MSVYDLSDNQLEELRENYFYQLADNHEDILEDCECPEDIPMSVIFDHYSRISFVNDDFFCSCGD